MSGEPFQIYRESLIKFGMMESYFTFKLKAYGVEGELLWVPKTILKIKNKELF